MAFTKNMNNKTENNIRFVYFKSIGIAFLITMIIFLIVSIIATYTSISDSVIPLATSIIMIFSIALSGMLSAIAKEKNGLIHGLVTGLIYIILVLFIGWTIVDGFSFNRYILIKSIIGLLSGGVGGMIGVNLK